MIVRRKFAVVTYLTLLLQVYLVSSKALNQNALAQFNPQWQNQQGSQAIQKRYDPGEDEHSDHHHEPGYWKKKLIWKPGYKKVWKKAQKQIWKPGYKKIYKPIFVDTKRAVIREINVPEYKKKMKPVIREFKVPSYKNVQIVAWKKKYIPKWVKVGIPGEHPLGTDPHGWQYTSHDLWKKKLIWEPIWQKYLKNVKQQIFLTEKKIEWVEWWQKSFRIEKKVEWIPDKKLAWKEAWKQIWVPAYKDIWLPDWKKIWRPVWISEWFPAEDHHHPHDGWQDRKDNLAPNELPQQQQQHQQQLPVAQQFSQSPLQVKALDSITSDLVPPPSNQQSSWKVSN